MGRGVEFYRLLFCDSLRSFFKTFFFSGSGKGNLRDKSVCISLRTCCWSVLCNILYVSERKEGRNRSWG